MTSASLLTDAFDRVRKTVYAAAENLTPSQLAYRPDPDSNSIAWLVWHLARTQDDHIAGVTGDEQAWVRGGWAERFGLPPGDMATGYGQDPSEVGTLQVKSAEVLTAYYDAAHEATERFVSGVTDVGLAQVVDERWDPPVTLAVRLISVLSDNLQHAGQAAYLRGIIERGAA